MSKNGGEMKSKLNQTISLIFVLLLGCVGAIAEVSGVEAVTRPSKDVTIAFLRSGRIATMPVKVGAKVQEGQIVAELEDSAEQIQVKQLKLKSEDQTLVRARQASLDQAKVELKKIKKAFKTGASTELEVERAVLQVTMAKAELDLAEFQLTLAKLQYEEAKAQADRMKLKSPANGTVEAIMIDAGEAVDMQMKPVMRIVQIDPMWIDTPVPLLQGKKLLPGGDALVDFDFGDKETRKGKIVHVSSVADPASETLWVRVEVQNASMRPSGETVRVRFVEVENVGGDDVKSQLDQSKSGSE